MRECECPSPSRHRTASARKLPIDNGTGAVHLRECVASHQQIRSPSGVRRIRRSLRNRSKSFRNAEFVKAARSPRMPAIHPGDRPRPGAGSPALRRGRFARASVPRHIPQCRRRRWRSRTRSAIAESPHPRCGRGEIDRAAIELRQTRAPESQQVCRRQPGPAGSPRNPIAPTDTPSR